MSRQDRPQITELSAQLASRLESDSLPAQATAPAIRQTLYSAKDAGLLSEVTEAIEAHADGDPQIAELLGTLRED